MASARPVRPSRPAGPAAPPPPPGEVLGGLHHDPADMFLGPAGRALVVIIVVVALLPLVVVAAVVLAVARGWRAAWWQLAALGGAGAVVMVALWGPLWRSYQLGLAALAGAARDAWERRPLRLEGWGIVAHLGALSLTGGVALAGAVALWTEFGIGGHRVRRRSSVGESGRGALAWWRRRRLAGASVPHPSDGAAIGVTAAGRPAVITDDQAVQHVMLTGASGMGKSTLLLRLLEGVVCRLPAIVLDLKGDADLAAAICALAPERVDVWRIGGERGWNPLARGSISERVDLLIAMEEWSEPFYKRCAQAHLTWLIRIAELRGEVVSLERVEELLDLDQLEALAAPLRTTHAATDWRAFDTYVSALRDDRDALRGVRGFRSRLVALTQGDAGRSLRPEGALDLLTQVRDGRTTVVSIDGSAYGELAAQVGALALLDIKTAITPLRTEGGRRVYVVIDEFSVLDGEHVMSLVARARSAGAGVVLATQTLADLDRIDRSFTRQILGNASVKVAMRTDDPDDSERYARLMGTEEAWEPTQQVHVRGGTRLAIQTGMGSLRRVEQFRVHPNDLKSLGRGEAYLISKWPEHRVDRIRVVPPRVAPAQSGVKG